MKWLTPLAVAGLLLSACSLVNGSGAVDPVPVEEPLPLEALLPNISTSSARAEFDEAQMLLQQCMAAEGFSYYPTEIDAEVEVGALPPADLIAYADEHGYGLTEQLLPQATALEAIQAGVLPHYVEFDLTEFGLVETDPNLLYVQSLSPEEAEAYLIALDGLEEDEQSSSPNYGCNGRLHEQFENERQQTTAAQPLWLDEANRRINDQLDAAAAEFAVADRRWSECMVEHGFTEFAERIQGPESIRVAILEIVLQATDLATVLDATSVGELRELEMSVAAADADCYTTIFVPMSRGIEARIQTDVLTDLGVISNE